MLSEKVRIGVQEEWIRTINEQYTTSQFRTVNSWVDMTGRDYSSTNLERELAKAKRQVDYQDNLDNVPDCLVLSDRTGGTYRPDRP